MADVKSKFGGVPVEEDQPQSKFGGVYAGGGGRGGGARGQTGSDAAKFDVGPTQKFLSSVGNTIAAIPPAAFHGTVDALRFLTQDPLMQSSGGGNSGLSTPGPTADAAIQAQIDQARKARQSWNRGDKIEALGHGGAASLPVLGPAAAHAGETIGGELEYGDLQHPERPTGVVRSPDPAKGLGEAVPLVVLSSPKNITERS